MPLLFDPSFSLSVRLLLPLSAGLSASMRPCVRLFFRRLREGVIKSVFVVLSSQTHPRLFASCGLSAVSLRKPRPQPQGVSLSTRAGETLGCGLSSPQMCGIEDVERWLRWLHRRTMRHAPLTACKQAGDQGSRGHVQCLSWWKIQQVFSLAYRR